VTSLSLLVSRSSAPPGPTPPDEGLGLLMHLFDTAPAATEPLPDARDRLDLLALVRGWVQRAASWGAGPQGAWRAW
jgi:hypothetical protein